MKITITFRHLTSSPAIKEHVEAKLERLDKYARKPLEAHVILDLEKNRHTAEIVVTGKGVQTTGTFTSDDMYTSIEAAVDKVEKALRRIHEKKVKAKVHAAARA